MAVWAVREQDQTILLARTKRLAEPTGCHVVHVPVIPNHHPISNTNHRALPARPVPFLNLRYEMQRTHLPRHPSQPSGTPFQPRRHIAEDLAGIVNGVLRTCIVVDVERDVLELGCFGREGGEEGVVLSMEGEER